MMTPKRCAVALLVCLLLTIGGCSDGDDNPAGDLAGNYLGNIQDSRVGTGTLVLGLGGTGNNLTGTWSTTFINPNNNTSGSLTGTVNDDTLNLTLIPSVSTDCPLSVTGRVNGRQINGTYAAFNCTVASSGSFAVNRQ